MKYSVALILTLVTLLAFAQKKTSFDLANYTVPLGWKETSRTKDRVIHAITNDQTGTFCQAVIYASTESSGNLQTDFDFNWQELVVKMYKPTGQRELIPAQSEGGWEAQGGVAPFAFEGKPCIVMLVTTTGYSRCMSMLLMTNTEAYNADMEKLLASVQMNKPATTTPVVSGTTNSSTSVQKSTEKVVSTPATKSAYTFTTTNFDDGWTSTVQEDWVEVVKGNIKVLIHFPNQQADEYNPDALNQTKLAWNLLVAPRYSAAPNLDFRHISGWQSIQLAEADAVERATGKMVHVVFFKKNYSGGTGKYLEIIAPNKQTFDAAFGTYDATLASWDKLEPMANYNKFAVSAADLKGKWTNDFTATQQYVNAQTGAYAGMTSYASRQNFEFTGSNYKWDIVVASGVVGSLKFDNAKSNGTFSVPTPWQVSFSDIEGKPKTYNAWFVCVKGGRVLWLDTVGFGKM